MASLEPDVCVRHVGEMPKVFAIARYQSKHQLRVNNTLHQMVEITEVDQKLMPFLDGEKSLDTVIRLVEEWVNSGIFNIQFEESENPAGVPDRREMISLLVEERLGFYIRNALLVG